jgi:hypothetical protein
MRALLIAAGAAVAAAGLALGGLGGLAALAREPAPRAAFTPPVGLEALQSSAEDPFAWMMSAEARASLDAQLVALSERQAAELRALPRYRRFVDSVELSYEAGRLPYVMPSFVRGRLVAVEDGYLYLGDDVEPLFDPAAATGYEAWTIDSWTASPDERHLAVTVFEAGAEHGKSIVVGLDDRRIVQVIEPAIGEGPVSWLSDAVMAVSHPRTLDFAGHDLRAPRGLRQGWRKSRLPSGTPLWRSSA